jgi:hypothetical protein
MHTVDSTVHVLAKIYNMHIKGMNIIIARESGHNLTN